MSEKTSEIAEPLSPRRWNLMHPIRWVPDDAHAARRRLQRRRSFCSTAGRAIRAWRWPALRSIPTPWKSRRVLPPDIELHQAGGDALPFEADHFDCVTCIEVLEHIPTELRRASLLEMRRVLRPGGRLALRTPHAGLFGWLDPHNLRFRFPKLYGLLVGRGAGRTLRKRGP